MAGPFDLTADFISDTYQRLLQISGSNNTVLDGTGSVVIVTLSGSFSGDGSGLTGVGTAGAGSGSIIDGGGRLTGSALFDGGIRV